MYLTPEDFLHANPDLETNFLAFFAHLFYILEIVPNPQYVKSRGQFSISNSNICCKYICSNLVRVKSDFLLTFFLVLFNNQLFFLVEMN